VPWSHIPNKSLNAVSIVQEHRIIAVRPARNSRPVVQQQQNTDRRKCSVCVEQHTSLNRMSGVGADGCQKRAGNRLPSTTVPERVRRCRETELVIR